MRQKYLSLVLVISFIFSSFALGYRNVFADEVPEEQECKYLDYVYGRHRLIESEEELILYLRECAVNRDDVVKLYALNTDVARACSNMYSLWNEKVVFHTGVGVEGDYILATAVGGANANVLRTFICNDELLYVEISMRFMTNCEQEQEQQEVVEEILESLDLEGLSDYQKLYRIYDWMYRNMTYDYVNYHKDYGDKDVLMYTAYAAAVRRIAVCQGFACLLYDMLLQAGVESRIILSPADDHAWNIVKINGLYYNVDITWELPGENQAFYEHPFRWFLLSCDDFYNDYAHHFFNALYSDINYAIALDSLTEEPTELCSHVFDNNCDSYCNICGIGRRTVGHSLDYRCDEYCNWCGEYVEPSEEHYFRYACSDTCLHCGETREPIQAHTYDNDCDTTCNVCDVVRTTEHIYEYDCSRECSICGVERLTESEHTYNDDCDTDCNVCGAVREITHIYDNDCDADCNVCGVVREVSHTYDNACDAVCNICGDTRSVANHIYDNDCDSECNVCHAVRVTTHTYDDMYDAKCNVCGSVRTVPTRPQPTTPEVQPTVEITPIPTLTPVPTSMPTPVPSTSTEVDGARSFVERLYTVALGRTADENGLNNWVEALHNGTTGSEAAKGFLFSEEFLNKPISNDEFVRILYRTFFDRVADEGGLNGWVSALNSGEITKQEVIQGFIDSSEWSNVCLNYGIVSGGNGTPTIEVAPNDKIVAFATRMYTTCLKRTPDENGLMAWARQLANLRDTGTNAAHGFFFSEEMNNSGISNEEFVTRLYLTFMDRQPDSAGYNAWVGQLNSGEATREEVFQGFAQSNEFGRICSNYGIIR